MRPSSSLDLRADVGYFKEGIFGKLVAVNIYWNNKSNVNVVAQGGSYTQPVNAEDVTFFYCIVLSHGDSD